MTKTNSKTKTLKPHSSKTLADFDVKPPTIDNEDIARSLHERAMLVRSTISRWYGLGADEEIVAELRTAKKATGDIGSFTKRFMTRDRLRKINAVTAEARKYHKSVTLPWGDAGARLLNVQQFFEYKKKMSAFERDFYIAVEEFLAQYPQAILDQRERLGELWHEHDYPSVEAMRHRFRFTVLVEPLATGEDFRVKLSKDESEELRREYDAEVRVRMKGAVQDVFERVQEAVQELAEKLADSDASIRKTSFDGLRRLVASLPQLNAIVQDPNIAQLGNAIARELLSLDAGEVKESPAVRTSAKQKADNILAVLKPLRQSWETNNGAA